jgi:peptidoglycan/LPS O-acetylase OafA/YrhL
MAGVQPKAGALGPNGIACLDLLRAIAANLVLFGHANDIFGMKSGIPAGLIGVSIFFLLSGFLITQSSLSRIRYTGPHFNNYIVDRFARIFSVYIPVLLIISVLNGMFNLGRWGQDGTSTGPVALFGNMLQLQDYPLFQALRHVAGGALYIRPYNTAEPFWTVAIEFWIYVVFGVGFFGLLAREKLGRVVVPTLTVVALPVVIWNAAAGGGNGLSLVWMVGALAAYVWSTLWHSSNSKLRIGSVVFAVAAVCLLGRGMKFTWNFQDLGTVLCEAMVLLGGLSMVEGAPAIPRWVRATCSFFASYSYSLYLVHNTVLVIFYQIFASKIDIKSAVLALAVAHAVAYATYLLFERHYRRVGKWIKQHMMSLPPRPERGVTMEELAPNFRPEPAPILNGAREGAE